MTKWRDSTVLADPVTSIDVEDLVSFDAAFSLAQVVELPVGPIHLVSLHRTS